MASQCVSFSTADAHKLQKLSHTAVALMAEITTLHELLEGVVCKNEDDNNEFQNQETMQLQTLLQKKYALLSTIDTLRAHVLDPIQ